MNTRKTAIILVLCILASSLALTVSAAVPEPVIPRWDNSSGATAYLSFNGNVGTVEAYIVGATGVTNIDATVTLYYKTSAGEWIEIAKDWDYNVNQDSLSISETFIGIRGREHKIVVDATLTKNGVTETVSDSAIALCQGH